jgi:hypothetical protein
MPAAGSILVERPRTASFAQRLPIYLLCAILVFAAAVRFYYFNPDLRRTPDERIYTRQANVLLDQGTVGYRFLGEELAKDPSVALFPSPLRAGYLAVLVAFMRCTGDTSILAGAHLSFICDLALLLLVALMGYRQFSPTVAVVATLFLAVFPFDLTVYRRSWQESYIALLAMATVCLCAFIARTQSGRLWGLAGFALLGFAALSTKENAGITFLLCAAGLTLYFILQRDNRSALLTACSAALAVVAYLCVMSALFGGLSSFLHLEDLTLHTPVNPYIQAYDSGPVWMFPAALFRTSPFLFLAVLTGFTVTVCRVWRAGTPGSVGLPLGIALLTFSILLLELLTQHYAFRFAAPVYGSICLLAGIGVEAVLPVVRELLAPLGRVTAWVVLGFALSLAALRDFNFAQENFLLPEIPDLALRPVLGVPPLPLPPAQ